MWPNYVEVLTEDNIADPPFGVRPDMRKDILEPCGWLAVWFGGANPEKTKAIKTLKRLIGLKSSWMDRKDYEFNGLKTTIDSLVIWSHLDPTISREEKAQALNAMNQELGYVFTDHIYKTPEKDWEPR